MNYQQATDLVEAINAGALFLLIIAIVQLLNFFRKIANDE
jgi:hypothetical protein